MSSCAVCNATILFGGQRVGELIFCSARCLILGRSLYEQHLEREPASDSPSIREIREDLIALAEDLQRQQWLLTETAERVDVLERLLTRSREAERDEPPPSGTRWRAVAGPDE